MERGRVGRKQNFTRALFSFWLFLRLLSAKVNGARSRCRESNGSRALNVGSHGIRDADSSVRRQSNGGDGERRGANERNEAEVGEKAARATHVGFHEQLGNGERAIMHAVCVVYLAATCTREKKLRTFDHHRLRYGQLVVGR